MPDRDQLGGLLASLDRLGESELLALSIKPTGEEKRALVRARKKAAQVAEANDRADDLMKLEGEIVTWSRAGGARSSMWVPNLVVPGDIMLAELRGGAARAVVDAAIALLLQDELDAATKATLLHRWECTPR